MRRRNIPASLTTLCALLLILARSSAVSGAESNPGEAKAADAADPVAKVKQLNATAMEYFDDLNYAMAEKTLIEALSIIEKSNLTGPPVLSTNGNLAVLYSAGFKKPDKAVFHFKKALALKPDLKLSKQRATPETEANLARAKAELAGSSGAAKPAEAGIGPSQAESANPNALNCPTGGEIHTGEEIPFKCTTGGTLKPATVMLYYKPNNGEEFQALQMTKEGTSGGVTTWGAKVPGAHTQADAVPFFFEANDASGESLGQSGSETSPSVITVKGAAIAAGPPPVGGGEEGDEEEEEEGEEEIDDSNPLAAIERERWREHEGSRGTWMISLGAGSGLGYASGKSTEAFGKFGVGFSAGFAPASLGHLTWELGYFVGRKTALAIGGRHQGVFGGPPGTATGAHSLLLRSLFFTEEDGKVRWYFALAAGGGEGFRLRVEATRNDPDTGEPVGTVKDTVRGGPLVAGCGAGMLYKIGRRMRLSIDTQALAGFPKFSAVFDLTAGVRWLF